MTKLMLLEERNRNIALGISMLAFCEDYATIVDAIVAVRDFFFSRWRAAFRSLAGALHLKFGGIQHRNWKVERFLPLAEPIAARLKARSETIAIAESSTGGLISAALLAMPGARPISSAVPSPIRVRRRASSLLSMMCARAISSGDRVARTPARAPRPGAIHGHMGAWRNRRRRAERQSVRRRGRALFLAIAGTVERAITLETARSDRIANMRAFAAAALELLAGSLAR